jgi:hypothetical protein
MKSIKLSILFSVYLLINSCITPFIPESNEYKELLVVEGLITDQYGINTVKLSKTLPLWERKRTAKPLKGCTVTISDEGGNLYQLTEKSAGTYITDSAKFQGNIGNKYVLHIKTNNPPLYNYSYESLPVEMKAVPPIDTIFYEKKVITEKDESHPFQEEGCQVYINTHGPSDYCRYYRWEYTETWEFRLPFSWPVNHVCWTSSNSSVINIKNTSGLSENRVYRYPLNFISNNTDRLNVKYSILVNQYSLNEDEFSYWEKRKNITENVGTLYDITPAELPGNIYCIENPGEKVLGYFSVSARDSKRVFIKDYFAGLVNLYSDCISDTIYGSAPIPNLNSSVWILEEVLFPYANPPYRVLTEIRGCADCTVRGSNVKPVFWDDNN